MQLSLFPLSMSKLVSKSKDSFPHSGLRTTNLSNRIAADGTIRGCSSLPAFPSIVLYILPLIFNFKRERSARLFRAAFGFFPGFFAHGVADIMRIQLLLRRRMRRRGKGKAHPLAPRRAKKYRGEKAKETSVGMRGWLEAAL